MLAQVESADGVEAAWIDGKGKLIRVRAREGTDVAAILAKVGLSVELVRWHSREETIRFSEEEAKILAERYASRVSLPEPETKKLRALLERKILEQFRKNHEAKDVKQVVEIDREGILKEAAEFLTAEQLDALKAAFQR